VAHRADAGRTYELTVDHDDLHVAEAVVWPEIAIDGGAFHELAFFGNVGVLDIQEDVTPNKPLPSRSDKTSADASCTEDRPRRVEIANQVLPAYRLCVSFGPQEGTEATRPGAVLTKVIQPAFAKFGIHGAGWHTFRHTVGTLLAGRGEHQLTIRELDLLVETTPPGNIASTSLPCAERLVFEVACRYLLVTFRLLCRLIQ